MKRNEILGELNSAKITAIKPGDSATVDTGQGITTTVDLKKNPTALMKDPESGKLKLTTTPTATNASPEQGGQEKSEIKPGDEIEIAAQERLRTLAGLPTNEQNPADQIAKDTQALGLGMKPQEFAPGEVKPSQIFGHPQWLSTVQAMHKKYPGNKDQAMQAAKDAVTQLIKQGK